MKDVKKRDELIFGRVLSDEEMLGGVAYFGEGNYCKGKPITIDMAIQLVNDKYLDPDEYQNNSPSVSELMELCSKYPQVKMEGYVVSPKRDDCRVSIDGLICRNDITEELITEFSNLCHDADDFYVGKDVLRSWWD